MSPDEIITKAKKRVKDEQSSFDWNGYFAQIIDEIFSAKSWRFTRQEMNYIHPQSTFEYRMNHTSTELALNKLIAAYYSLSYAIVGGVPVPVTNSAQSLEYWPYADFLQYFPDHLTDGNPRFITELIANDGTTGMQLGIFERPSADAAVWIYGDFIPSYNINASPLPILPLQFHRLVFYGLVREAAEDKGRESLYNKHARKFDVTLAQLDEWDRRQPIYRPRFQSYAGSAIRKRPFYPSNFDISVSR